MKRKISVVDISSDEDEELKLALKLSQQQSGKLQRKFDGKGFFLNSLEGQYPKASTVKIEEIIDIEHLKSFSFSTFTLEMEFLNQLIPPHKDIPITICKHWSTQSGDSQGNFLLKNQTICVCHPKIEHYGSVHSKIWFLEYEDFLRITVTSGNMTKADWNSYIQVVWVQDFPKKESKTKESNDFRETLYDFWKHCTNNLNTNWLDKYDFSSAQVDLIPSIPGYHRTNQRDKYGHMRLRKLLEKYNVQSNKSVYYQSSSIGTIYENWLNGVLESFKCKKSNFNLVFPNVLTVNRSKLGIFGAGMCFLPQKAYDLKAFPKENLTNFEPLTKNYLLSHSKMIVSLDLKDDKLTSWGMIGSHNFSGAALGKLQKNDSQLHILNYELSVFFKPKVYENISKISNENIPNEIPIPFKVPGKRYEKDEYPYIQKD